MVSVMDLSSLMTDDILESADVPKAKVLDVQVQKKGNIVCDVGTAAGIIDPNGPNGQGAAFTHTDQNETYITEQRVISDNFPIHANERLAFIYNRAIEVVQIQPLSRVERGFAKIAELDRESRQGVLQPLNESAAPVFFTEANLRHIEAQYSLDCRFFDLLRVGDTLQYAAMEDKCNEITMKRQNSAVKRRAARVNFFHAYSFAISEGHNMLGIVMKKRDSEGDSILALSPGLGWVHVGCSVCGKGQELKDVVGIRVMMEVRRFNLGAPSDCQRHDKTMTFCSQYQVLPDDVNMGPAETAFMCDDVCNHHGIDIHPLFRFPLFHAPCNRPEGRRQAFVIMLSYHYGFLYSGDLKCPRVYFSRRVLVENVDPLAEEEQNKNGPLLTRLEIGDRVEYDQAQSSVRHLGSMTSAGRVLKVGAAVNSLPLGLQLATGVVEKVTSRSGCIRLENGLRVYFDGTELPTPPARLTQLFSVGQSHEILYCFSALENGRSQLVVQCFPKMQVAAKQRFREDPSEVPVDPETVVVPPPRSVEISQRPRPRRDRRGQRPTDGDERWPSLANSGSGVREEEREDIRRTYMPRQRRAPNRGRDDRQAYATVFGQNRVPTGLLYGRYMKKSGEDAEGGAGEVAAEETERTDHEFEHPSFKNIVVKERVEQHGSSGDEGPGTSSAPTSSTSGEVRLSTGSDESLTVELNSGSLKAPEKRDIAVVEDVPVGVLIEF